MRNFTYLCINGLDSYVCTWIYMFFYKIWIFYVFLSLPVFFRLRSGFQSSSHFGLCRFNDRSGSDNIDLDASLTQASSLVRERKKNKFAWEKNSCLWRHLILRVFHLIFFSGSLCGRASSSWIVLEYILLTHESIHQKFGVFFPFRVSQRRNLCVLVFCCACLSFNDPIAYGYCDIM